MKDFSINENLLIICRFKLTKIVIFQSQNGQVQTVLYK